MRVNWDEYFMNLALMVRERATCLRRQVGAVLIDPNNRILNTGYNGSPPGEPHCTDQGVGCNIVDGRCLRTIHAEVNVLNGVNWWKRRGSTLYNTALPCLDCAKLISKKGVAEVVYLENYPRTELEVKTLFEDQGIILRQFIPSYLHEPPLVA